MKGEEETQVSKLNQTERLKRKIKHEQDKNIFKENCIFCNKEGKKAKKRHGIWSTQKLKQFKKEDWKGVVCRAEGKGDERLLTHIRGYDLLAAKSKYHVTCRSEYMGKTE